MKKVTREWLSLQGEEEKRSLKIPSEKAQEQLKLVLNTESESYRHKSIKGQHRVGHSGGRGCYWMVHSTDLWLDDGPGFTYEHTEAGPRMTGLLRFSMPPLPSFQSWWEMGVRPEPREAHLQTSQELGKTCSQKGKGQLTGLQSFFPTGTWRGEERRWESWWRARKAKRRQNVSKEKLKA